MGCISFGATLAGAELTECARVAVRDQGVALLDGAEAVRNPDEGAVCLLDAQHRYALASKLELLEGPTHRPVISAYLNLAMANMSIGHTR